MHLAVRLFVLALAGAACGAGSFIAVALAQPSDSTSARLDSTSVNEPTPHVAGFRPNLKPNIQAVRSDGPIKIDGELDEPIWHKAPCARNFAQWNPSNMEKPPVDTEARVAFDDDNLYVALIAFDDPKSVRAGLRDRDQIFQDDFIGLFIDTMGDGSWAYEIWANPIGIQGDLLWTPTTEDERFDMIYSSKGKITDRGYQVEMAIPFSSLRFPSKNVQTWRTTFWRNHPRTTRGQYSWAGISRNEPCWQCQWGTMTGIENVRGGGNLEFLPSFTASQTGLLRDQNDLTSGLRTKPVDADAGFNLRYTFASNLSSAIAVNPDFSQIESDATQIDVNTTFALLYPEKRPFFQEGSDLINTNMTAIYTRSINDPSVAGRFTGRANRSSFVVAAARDEHTPFVIPFEEETGVISAGQSNSVLARYKQTFWSDSNAGLLFTDRRHDGGGSGTVLGGDGTFRFLRNFRLEWQALASHAEEPTDSSLSADLTSQLVTTTFDGGRHTAALDGESYWGHALYASLKRDGRVWNVDTQFHEYSPTFRADNGFIVQNNIRQSYAWTGLDFRPKKSFFILVTPNISVNRDWNFDGTQKFDQLRPELYVQFKGQSEAWVAHVWSRERFRGKEFPDLRRVGTWGQSRFSNPVTFGYFVQFGRFIARNLADPILGHGMNAELWSTLKPSYQLIVEPHLYYSVLHHPDHGPRIFEGYIFRNRLQYQFTRELFLRTIIQYDSFAHALEVDPLLSYKVNPFTVAYLGSTHGYFDPGGEASFTATQRVIFMKLQYLFRV
jgi:hypothetical protein